MLIDLSHIAENLSLKIVPVKDDYVCEKVDDAYLHGEAPYQIAEGQFYHFSFSDEQFGLAKCEVVEPFIGRNSIGRIAPNIYVGTLSLKVIDCSSEEAKGIVRLEVQSQKTDYRSDYRSMLEDITESCTDLLMQINSPVDQSYEVDFGADNKTDYQRFAFISSIVGSEAFTEAVSRIVSSPTTKWKEETELVDIRKVRRFNQANLRQLINRSNRTSVPSKHGLRTHGISSIPLKIDDRIKSESTDTQENRFIKHALEVFLKFITDFHSSVDEKTRESAEASLLINKLEEFLGHGFFKTISRPTSLKLNSPVLQRKEGYREVLKSWLIFDLAAKLIWEGGEDVYSAGKRDIATLYEYWLFFKLLDLLSDIFDIEPKDIEDLIKPTKSGLGLQLKQGSHIALQGTFKSASRNLLVCFSYNRQFEGAQPYPKKGSWTKSMKPDYTLTFWPDGVSEDAAEEQELITHVHFDAKYKIANLREFIDAKKHPNEEKREQARGVYKNVDILKMHAYRDSIRRTSGAYVLYPGNEEVYNEKGFHEILPGLGAFPVRPDRSNSGISDLKNFILEVIDHSLNRASQKERMSMKQYQVHRDEPSNEVREALPEAYGINRDFHPDDVTVLVGYYKSQKQLDWIESKLLYNARINSVKGSIELDTPMVGVQYLLLHTKGDKLANRLFKVNEKGHRIFTKAEMIKKGYPDPRQDAYLVFRISELNLLEFGNASWDFKKLERFESHRGSGKPFVATLSELMKVKSKA